MSAAGRLGWPFANSSRHAFNRLLGPQLEYIANAYCICPACRDQRLYVQQLPEGDVAADDAVPLTAADSKQRFADGEADAGRDR